MYKEVNCISDWVSLQRIKERKKERKEMGWVVGAVIYEAKL